MSLFPIPDRYFSGAIQPDQCSGVKFWYDGDAGGNPQGNRYGRIGEVRTYVCRPGQSAQEMRFIYEYTDAGLTSKHTMRTGSGGFDAILTWDAIYDGFGKLSYFKYPDTYNSSNSALVPGPYYNISYDSQQRPVSLKENNTTDLVQSVAYDVAGRPTGVTFTNTSGWMNGTLNFSYSDRGQLTREWFSAAGRLDMTYEYSNAQPALNTGRVTKSRLTPSPASTLLISMMN